MAFFVEKTAKSIDEAVAEALNELNITAEQADIEVLDEGRKGFFGFLGKDAKVRVNVKASVVETTETVPEKTVSEAATIAVNAVKEAVSITADAVIKKADAVKADVNAAAEELSQKAINVKEHAVDSAISKLESLKTERSVKYVVNEQAITSAKEFLQRIFDAMKIEVAVEKFVNKNDGSVTFKLHGDDMGILIGKHGQTLDSLQYLTNLVANKNSSERVRVIIDVEDYRDRRVETLTRLANRLADKVKRTGERVELEPMNPHERKIIHMALQGDRRVTTLSEGDDPYRHVVIELKK